MTNEDLGFNNALMQYRSENGLDSFEFGRVVLEHRERYVIKTENEELDAELTGNMRFAAENRYDLPAVGDWVAYSAYDEGKALIHAVYPRSSVLERPAVGSAGRVQIIATNVDYAFIVQATDRDFNLNRLERYLTVCHASGVKPIVVLSKTDLIAPHELEGLVARIEGRIGNLPVVAIHNQASGYDALKGSIEKGKTYCLLGSSGVGKSTLLNGLLGKAWLKTNEISSSVNKGRHTTSHRELVVLDNGGIVIDNPGMREVGISDSAGGLEITFDEIVERAQYCNFKDCTHVHETGCAVLEALEKGEIDPQAYQNFRKMERERMHFETDAKDRRKKDRAQGKLYRRIKQERKNNKY